MIALPASTPRPGAHDRDHKEHHDSENDERHDRFMHVTRMVTAHRPGNPSTGNSSAFRSPTSRGTKHRSPRTPTTTPALLCGACATRPNCSPAWAESSCSPPTRPPLGRIPSRERSRFLGDQAASLRCVPQCAGDRATGVASIKAVAPVTTVALNRTALGRRRGNPAAVTVARPPTAAVVECARVCRPARDNTARELARAVVPRRVQHHDRTGHTATAIAASRSTVGCRAASRGVPRQASGPAIEAIPAAAGTVAADAAISAVPASVRDGMEQFESAGHAPSVGAGR